MVAVLKLVRGVVGCLCLGIIAPQALAAQTFVGRVTSVPDGDTLWVVPDAGGKPQKLRLLGIDAPEICQPGGPEARDALQALVGRQKVEVEVQRNDDYGRGLARLRVGGSDVGATLVRQGKVWSYRWRRSLGPYAPQEQAARAARLGIFVIPSPELPRDFRKRHGPCGDHAKR